MQLVSKISNLRGPDPPTLQTDRRTDRRTERQTDDMRSQYRALRYSASRGKNGSERLVVLSSDTDVLILFLYYWRLEASSGPPKQPMDRPGPQGQQQHTTSWFVEAIHRARSFGVTVDATVLADYALTTPTEWSELKSEGLEEVWIKLVSGIIKICSSPWSCR